MALGNRRQQSREIHHIGARQQDEGGPITHGGKGIGAEKSLILRGDGGSDKDHIRTCDRLLQAGRGGAGLTDPRFGQPRIMDLQPRTEA